MEEAAGAVDAALQGTPFLRPVRKELSELESAYAHGQEC